MKVTNLTPEISVTDNQEIQFGVLNKNSVTTVKFLVEDVQYSKAGVSCGGCTIAKGIQIGNNVEFTIQYTAQSKGNFNKSATLYLTDGQKVDFKLNGTVK